MPDLIDHDPTELGGDVQHDVAALYDATVNHVFGVAMALLGEQSAAEDVTRDVYVAVDRGLTSPSPGCPSSLPCLVLLAHRLAVEALRRRWHGGAVPRGLDETNRVPRHASTPLSLLSEQERTALTNAWFGGRTHADVDVIVQMPTGSSAQHLREGLRRLAASAPRAL